jgi:hypothetical protein
LASTCDGGVDRVEEMRRDAAPLTSPSTAVRW